MMTIIIIIIKNLAQVAGLSIFTHPPSWLYFQMRLWIPLYMVRNDKEDDDDDEEEEEKLASWKLFWLVDLITNDVS